LDREGGGGFFGLSLTFSWTLFGGPLFLPIFAIAFPLTT
jgi:hypothetical protein